MSKDIPDFKQNETILNLHQQKKQRLEREKQEREEHLRKKAILEEQQLNEFEEKFNKCMFIIIEFLTSDKVQSNPGIESVAIDYTQIVDGYWKIQDKPLKQIVEKSKSNWSNIMEPKGWSIYYSNETPDSIMINVECIE